MKLLLINLFVVIFSFVGSILLYYNEKAIFLSIIVAVVPPIISLIISVFDYKENSHRDIKISLLVSMEILGYICIYSVEENFSLSLKPVSYNLMFKNYRLPDNKTMVLNQLNRNMDLINEFLKEFKLTKRADELVDLWSNSPSSIHKMVNEYKTKLRLSKAEEQLFDKTKEKAKPKNNQTY